MVEYLKLIIICVLSFCIGIFAGSEVSRNKKIELSPELIEANCVNEFNDNIVIDKPYSIAIHPNGWIGIWLTEKDKLPNHVFLTDIKISCLNRDYKIGVLK